MKSWLKALSTLLVLAAALWALQTRHGSLPPLGKFLDPVNGFWRNNAASDSIPETLEIAGLRGRVTVVWDDRHVPHIFAANEDDLYRAQGYLTARDRLWQMDFLSRYAGGRLAEVIGPRVRGDGPAAAPPGHDLGGRELPQGHRRRCRHAPGPRCLLRRRQRLRRCAHAGRLSPRIQDPGLCPEPLDAVRHRAAPEIHGLGPDRLWQRAGTDADAAGGGRGRC